MPMSPAALPGIARLEAPPSPRTSWRQVRADFGLGYAATGFIGWVFSATAPVAVILSVGTRGGLSEAQLSSWIFGVFCINGLITLLFCWLYRQPLAFFWTIPGTVLVGPALSHLTFAEVVGAYIVTALLMLALGLSGLVRRAMQAVPMPIVMGMVAGVFLRFGTDLVRSLHDDLAIAGPMVAVWLALSAFPAAARRVPPMIAALVVGIAASALLGRIDAGSLGPLQLARPVFTAPAWSLPAMIELVIPLAITVLVVQNGQGVAVLRGAGHEPPIDGIAVACGAGALASAMVGAVSTCLTGPTNAILVSSGQRTRQYTAGMFTGSVAIVFGLMAPAFTRFMLQVPRAFIMTLAGLAMLRVLESAFVASFGQRFTLGALVAFLVTVADLSLLNIGAAFWGLAAGIAISLLMERRDFIAPDAAR